MLGRVNSPPTSPEPAAAYPVEPWRAALVPPEPAPGDLHFTCPRCADEVSQAAYGPCASCRAELRATLGGEQRPLAQHDYVPKLNVTPNAVALKD